MDDDDQAERLSCITTRWSLIFDAQRGTLDTAQAAQAEMIRQYARPVFRYFLGATRDKDVAEDLSQEFVVRLLSGRFRQADPQRGRFRHYLKTCLANMLKDHYRSRSQWPQPLPSDTADPFSIDSQAAEEEFAVSWRQQVLDITWQALSSANAFYFEVLRLRSDEPDLTSSEMAARLSTNDRQVTAEVVRKTSQRAQAKFADLLLHQVGKSIDSVDREQLRLELKELDLLRFCRHALDRWEGE